MAWANKEIVIKLGRDQLCYKGCYPTLYTQAAEKVKGLCAHDYYQEEKSEEYRNFYQKNR